jgi:hypothetical protein
MNIFFDYIFIRIFLWYESFKDQASKFTSNLLVGFFQACLTMIFVFQFGFIIVLSRGVIIFIWISLSLLFFYRAFLRYNDDYILELINNWKNEEKAKRKLKGYGIFFMLLSVFVLTVFVGFLILPKT